MHPTNNGGEKYYNGWNRFNSVNVGVSIPLTFGATKARIQSLEYQRQAAENNAKLQQQQLTTQFDTAMRQYRQDVDQYNYYVQQAIPNAEKLLKPHNSVTAPEIFLM